mgnify:CR=1 FL=1
MNKLLLDKVNELSVELNEKQIEKNLSLFKIVSKTFSILATIFKLDLPKVKLKETK